MSEFWEYSYDLADQLESIAIAVGAEYECDTVDRLRQVKVEGDVIMRHIYDAEGIRRLSKDDNGDRSRFSSSAGCRWPISRQGRSCVRIASSVVLVSGTRAVV